jgi:hypothetical protein
MSAGYGANPAVRLGVLNRCLDFFVGVSGTLLGHHAPRRGILGRPVTFVNINGLRVNSCKDMADNPAYPVQ